MPSADEVPNAFPGMAQEECEDLGGCWDAGASLCTTGAGFAAPASVPAGAVHLCSDGGFASHAVVAARRPPRP